MLFHSFIHSEYEYETVKLMAGPTMCPPQSGFQALSTKLGGQKGSVLDITREQCDTKLESRRLESLVSHCSREISGVSNKHSNYHLIKIVTQIVKYQRCCNTNCQVSKVL